MLYKKQNVCYICKKEFSTNDIIKSIIKSEVIAIILGIIEELQYKIAKVFYNGSTYDDHFIIKELAEKLRVDLNAKEKIHNITTYYFFSAN